MKLELVKTTDTGHIDYIIEKEKNFSYLGENIMLSKEDLISLIDEEGGLVSIIKSENVSAGYVIMLPYEEKHCEILEINTVFIESAFRNKGIAERAVKEAIKIAETQNGLSEYKLVSQVATTNGSSQRLMDKLKLSKVILFEEFYSLSKTDAYIYNKLIKGGFTS